MTSQNGEKYTRVVYKDGFLFVARPIFRINIYGAYFVKIEKMLARPKNHQKIVARPNLARRDKEKTCSGRSLYTAPA